MTETGLAPFHDKVDTTATWVAPDINLIQNIKMVIDFKVDRFFEKRGIPPADRKRSYFSHH